MNLFSWLLDDIEGFVFLALPILIVLVVVGLWWKEKST